MNKNKNLNQSLLIITICFILTVFLSIFFYYKFYGIYYNMGNKMVNYASISYILSLFLNKKNIKIDLLPFFYGFSTPLFIVGTSLMLPNILNYYHYF